MVFHIGPVAYTLIIADRRIYDEEGNELEGRAIEAVRMIVLSRAIAPDRRVEVLRHEVQHCWHFHIPRPSNEEEECDLAAFIDQQFQADLDAQGGREAVARLIPQRVPELGRPAPAGKRPTPREILGQSDRMDCGCCGAAVMCGSIVNGEPTFHEETKQVRIERWMCCEACNSVTVWTELCTADGTPLGEFVSNPAPRLLRGREAAEWLAQKPVSCEVA